MAIHVVCPGCYARFKVSDKFAGMTGACPKCKKTITVPSADDEVKVHAPEDFGGARGASGKLVLKPIARLETRLSPVAIAGILASIVGVAAIAWGGGELLQTQWVVRAVGLLVITPPLVMAGYTFLRDQETEPYRGRAFYIRTGICALSYAVMWAVFGYSAEYVVGAEAWNWLLFAPPFVITGALIALACFDLDFGSGCFHYAFYVLVIILLRWIAGMGWIWTIGV